jgi:adenylyl cyclase-associated protein
LFGFFPAQAMKESHRRSPQENHVTMIAELAQAVSWAALAEKPAPFVTEMINAAQFYGNRILKDHRGKFAPTS